MQPQKLLKVETNILPKIELVQVKIKGKILPSVEKGNMPTVQSAKYQDFASRLKALMENESSPIKTVNQLKDAIDVTYEMARRYTLGIAKPREEKLKILADKLNVSISFLDHGTEITDHSSLHSIEIPSLIPVISWEDAKKWNVDGNNSSINIIEWLPQNSRCGKNGFGLIVSGVSMQPDFKPQDRIYINPDFTLKSMKTGNLVIVAFDNQDQADFKKIIVENNVKFLEPLNPKYLDKPILMQKNCKLIGKVVGMYRNI
ncbi:S24 family peptidase [Acinetobacter stercoris]|uniref:Putative HTH-type transcriptional regulator n=1 Tax=Acinetobacter stercoris TaxID=2126983 RepID=A0A2U3N3P5_9GAMM|nr:LexA family transcriptional regulator [Acinetobacter stercoris]SPL72298.1 putative HTH-type transcriptional regulator [Acinetobacter stercoris]